MDIAPFARRTLPTLSLSLVSVLAVLTPGCDKLPGRMGKRTPVSGGAEGTQMDGDPSASGDGIASDGASDGAADGEPAETADAATEDGATGADAGTNNPAPDASTPEPSTMAVRVEAENFDISDTGYYDTTPANEGGAGLTTEGVDVGMASDPETPGSLYIGYTKPGEWILYPFALDKTGDYTLRVRCAHETGGGDFSVFVDGNLLTTFTVPLTGGWQAWTTVEKAIGTLSEGTHTMKLTVDTAGPSSADGGNINYFDFVPAS